MTLDYGLVFHNSEHTALSCLTALSENNHLSAFDGNVDTVSEQSGFIVKNRVNVSKVCFSGCFFKLMYLNLLEASWHGEDCIFEYNI